MIDLAERIMAETLQSALQNCEKNVAKCILCHLCWIGETGIILGCKTDLVLKTEKGDSNHESEYHNRKS